MSIFESLGNVTQPQANPMQILSQLQRNPVNVLRQAGYNVPDGVNNPQQIINHLLASGQINNSRLGMAQQMARMFGRR